MLGLIAMAKINKFDRWDLYLQYVIIINPKFKKVVVVYIFVDRFDKKAYIDQKLKFLYNYVQLFIQFLGSTLTFLG